MDRIVSAFWNSMRALRRLTLTEKAFQQELALLVLAIPAGWFLATTWSGYALLIGAILVLIMVEVLNTGIEAACDAFSREFNVEIQLAKDCGSLAVLIAIILVLGVWGFAIVERLGGMPA
ncbi:diacylglycerol kinase [Kumtagia ephedrae]|jgi:diacylglycerol kinase (ATP)|uniref:Diacylglycerol kinase n=1 Tax=Kumtagia ephedrae TaxID=2116701 RepID=A0A2P7SHC1_9HYPH|nr:diacylglycerol kinase [Mesorhizobium ephedrae]PSJ61867.1 diacylglycerol kinase [Mesorhizobium ephedrae]